MVDTHPAFLHPTMQVANTLAAVNRTAHTAASKSASVRNVWAVQASATPAGVVPAHTMIADPLSPITRR